ncbi:hypothetical protein L226DRAFT_573674 [Lentinus tigrinus ALCF2SS1-7]|uniref:FMN-dependent dehydrogenase domain-containing protein n=1 Tax=Lentinus tigrinus ALCF2SS1-6 TaxID=1328759 RepID=A0A5C2S0S9_9APHY|nr:hypothetical protein L227DRAFT_614102 [Lentinus tigrinus ALCF2SS1-6]RPD71725.1 hypothetical protein L226DRAFT_573674 [Lentinus tigrinus ALCF2SS1-7]
MSVLTGIIAGSFNFVFGYTDKSETYRVNRHAFTKWQIVLRMLRDATYRSLEVAIGIQVALSAGIHEDAWTGAFQYDQREYDRLVKEGDEGIMTAEDAEIAIRGGIDGIIVSIHGIDQSPRCSHKKPWHGRS